MKLVPARIKEAVAVLTPVVVAAAAVVAAATAAVDPVVDQDRASGPIASIDPNE